MGLQRDGDRFWSAILREGHRKTGSYDLCTAPSREEELSILTETMRQAISMVLLFPPGCDLWTNCEKSRPKLSRLSRAFRRSLLYGESWRDALNALAQKCRRRASRGERSKPLTHLVTRPLLKYRHYRVGHQRLDGMFLHVLSPVSSADVSELPDIATCCPQQSEAGLDCGPRRR